MSALGSIPDIPKIYTALAEWAACVLYILVISNRSNLVRRWPLLLSGLVALTVIQILIGIIPVQVWLLGMACALGVVFLLIERTTGLDPRSSFYWMLRSFLLAEFAASLEWQLSSYSSAVAGWPSGVISRSILLVIVLGLVFPVFFLLETRQAYVPLSVSSRQLVPPIIITASTFALANLSYVYAATPFSSPLATEAFNIRTLVQLGGVAFLYAHHIQLRNMRNEAELEAFRSILSMQYAQYRQSKENIEILNHKYHDLKHQIAVLRAEEDPAKREAHLDDMERGIRDYEARFKTGNPVVDTVLTGKALSCTRHGITFTCVAEGSLIETLDVMDVCTILGNALDNAIEAEQAIADPERRLIHLSISRLSGFVLIRVENTIDGPIVFDGAFPKSTKGDPRNHGFGLRSIERIAASYGGSASVSTDDGTFELRILLPIAPS